MASGASSVEIPFGEDVSLKRKLVTEMTLLADAPAAVNFGALANAHVIYIRATGGKVKARITSADGATQAVPVDPHFSLVSLLVPVTAVDLTRQAGVSTSVSVFLGERA